jgi:hypothetical protein
MTVSESAQSARASAANSVVPRLPCQRLDGARKANRNLAREPRPQSGEVVECCHTRILADFEAYCPNSALAGLDYAISTISLSAIHCEIGSL